MRQIVETKEKESDQWKQKIEQMEKDIEDAVNKKYQLENKVAMISSEIERLNVKYKNSVTKIEELD